MPLAAANARQRKVLIAGGALLLAGAIGVLDYILGPEILLGLFYLVPISAAAWFGGKRSGLLVSGLSTVAWTVANVIPARHSHPAIAAWNAAWGLGFFLVVSLLVSKLRALNESLEKKVQEKTAALTEEAAEHKQTAEALIESEERLRLMIENVKDYAILMLDSSGRIETWNVGVERLTGYGETDIVGQPLSRLYSPEDVEEGKPLEVIAGATDHGAFEDEGLLVRQDGSHEINHEFCIVSTEFPEITYFVSVLWRALAQSLSSPRPGDQTTANLPSSASHRILKASSCLVRLTRKRQWRWYGKVPRQSGTFESLAKHQTQVAC
jgi:PAS domain S-box-containing protein